MTPKEKAEELFNKMLESGDDAVAKKCALIAVDLRLEIEYGKDRKEYWQQVKHEIDGI